MNNFEPFYLSLCLPFFHIYAMNTIMTVGLQIGAKIVTVPRFEPEMYIKALVTYRVGHWQKNEFSLDFNP